MIIKQEVIDVIAEGISNVTKKKCTSTKYGCAKGVKKYHIKKGIAKENPEFNRLKSIPKVIVKKKAEYEIEVENIRGL